MSKQSVNYGSSHRAVRPSELELLRKPPFRERGGFVRGVGSVPSGSTLPFFGHFQRGRVVHAGKRLMA